MSNLDPRSIELLHGIINYHKSRREYPTNKEMFWMSSARSMSVVNECLGELVAEGYISKEAHKPRGLKVLKKAPPLVKITVLDARKLVVRERTEYKKKLVKKKKAKKCDYARVRRQKENKVMTSLEDRYKQIVENAKANGTYYGM